jgi:hypothetical protein
MKPRTVALLMLALTSTVTLIAQQNPKFVAERDRLAEVAARIRAGQHITEQQLLYDNRPFNDAKVRIQKIAPGGSVNVTVPGEYPAGTVVLSERDGVALSGATMTATSYSARLTVAANEYPGFARLFGATPITFAQHQHNFLAVAFIDAVYRFDLKSAAGVVVKITPLEKSFTIDETQKHARLKYQGEFYKPGAVKPFETMTGFEEYENTSEAPSHLDIGFDQSTDSPEAEMEELSRQLGDPKLTDAQRNNLMLRLGQLQTRMLAGIANIQAAAAAEQKKNEDFGCGLVQIYPKQGGTVEATMLCGDNFYGGNQKMTGTMAIVR